MTPPDCEPPDMATLSVTGASGTKYTYDLYTIGTALIDEPGNYLWTRDEGDGHVLLYVGETGSLKDRVNNSHEKWPCVQRNNGTHVAAHINRAGQAARRAEEKDILDNHNATCNG